MSARELTIEQARGLAQQWAERKRFDDGEVYPDDCEACGGEAVPADAIDEHEDVCMYASHDVLDDGGGKCTTCGELLPACPACGPYHGRQAPPRALNDCEREALLGWVRRRMEREAERLENPACRICGARPTCYGKDDEPHLHCDDHCSHDDHGCRGYTVECAPSFADRKVLAYAVTVDLGGPLADSSGEHGLAWTLCEIAGWPS